MPQITHTATLGGVGDVFTTAITDLDIRTGSDGPVLYATTRPGGGVSAWALSGTGSGARLIDTQASAPGTPLTAASLELLDLDGTAYAVTLGLAGAALPALTLDAAGAITGTTTFTGGTGFQGDMVRMITAETGGETYVYAAHWGQGGLATYVLDTGGHLTGAGPDAASAPVTPGYEVSALLRIELNGDTFILAASPQDNGLTAYRVRADGQLRVTDTLGAADGLGVATPTALEHVTVDGVSYVIMAAAGSSSLSVMELTDDGRLIATDHVIDSLPTRFQSTTTLEVITIEGRSYVLAGGADDGFSLFELLPGGRLYHLGSVADSHTTTLDNVSALAAAVDGDVIQVFASSETEAGISQFTIDPGDLGQVLTGGNGANALTGGARDDLIAGGAGNDTLRGGNGADILMDGAGQDRLEGGGGADIFVLSADGQDDRITDFDPSRDTIDLSGWPMLRSSAQLDITSTSWGAIVRFGAEELRIYTANGQTLTALDFAAMDLINIDHLPLGNLSNGVLVEGGDGNNQLNGAASDDTLVGGAGDDTLRGGRGADELIGGVGKDAASYASAGSGVVADLKTPSNNTADAAGDTYDGVEDLIGSSYEDTLSGTGKANRIWGDGGADVISGRGGDDRLRGDGGSDLIQGDEGNDTIWGGTGYDTILGGKGNDTVYAGRMGDTLIGGAGADMLYGGKGNDLVSYATASTGITLDLANGALNTGDAAGDTFSAVEEFEGSQHDDVMRGDSTRDRLYGGDGDDVLAGRGENDKLVGGRGDDLLKGDDGRDLLRGDEGRDTLKGGKGDDTLEGGLDDDVLRGEGGRDLLLGQAGKDGINGGDGADTLDGGNGNDKLDGEGGNDLLIGGDGADQFLFRPGGGVDTISDFELGEDQLRLDDALWSGRLSAQDVVDTYGRVQGNKIVLNFGPGTSIVIEGVTDLEALVDDISIF